MLENRRKKYIVMLLSGMLAVMNTFSFTMLAAEEEGNFETDESRGEEKARTLQKDEFFYSFRINNILYSGNYEGEVEGGKPEGEGVFIADADSPYLFTYRGEFEDGFFNGEGTIEYENGDCLSGKFLDGVPTGKMYKEYSDGSYTLIYYWLGIPCRSTSEYSKDGTITGRDFYYDGYTINAWKQQVQKIDYRELYQNAKEYVGQLLKIDCTVIEVYEHQETCKFRVQDKEGNIYWGEYKNTIFQTFDQSIMPTLKVGDQLELYGFFRAIDRCVWSNEGQVSNSYPRITPLTGVLPNTELDYGNLSKDYEEILRFPYNYYNVYDVLKLTIHNLFYIGDKAYIRAEDEEGNIYYCHIRPTDDGKLPIAGDKIRVRGFYRGLYKEDYNVNKTESLTELYVYMDIYSARILK